MFKIFLKVLGDIVIFALIVALIILIVGCDTVKTGDRLVYEDGSAAKGISMSLSGNMYNARTYTGKDGNFTFLAPADIEVRLCAYPIGWEIDEACYEGSLYTPLKDGELLREKEVK